MDNNLALPGEILRSIWSYCSPRTAVRSGRVCRSWREAQDNEFWKGVFSRLPRPSETCDLRNRFVSLPSKHPFKDRVLSSLLLHPTPKRSLFTLHGPPTEDQHFTSNKGSSLQVTSENVFFGDYTSRLAYLTKQNEWKEMFGAGSISSLYFSPGLQLLDLTTEIGFHQVFHLEENQSLVLREEKYLDHPIQKIQREGDKLLVGFKTEGIVLRENEKSRTILKNTEFLDKMLVDLQWEGSCVYASLMSGQVIKQDLRREKPEVVLKGEGFSESLQVLGSELAMGDMNGIVRLYDERNTQTPLETYRHNKTIHRFQFDAFKLISGSVGGVVTLWDRAQSKPRTTIQVADCPITSLQYTESLLYYGLEDSRLEVLDFQSV